MTGRDRAAVDLGTDDRLLGRLRQLSLVDPDSLLAGLGGERRTELALAFADDLADALSQARGRMAELVQLIAAGPDPLLVLEASPALRARGAVGEGPGRLSARLADRAAACRDLARLDDACALLLPRLFEIHRRIGR